MYLHMMNTLVFELKFAILTESFIAYFTTAKYVVFSVLWFEILGTLQTI